MTRDEVNHVDLKSLRGMNGRSGIQIKITLPG